MRKNKLLSWFMVAFLLFQQGTSTALAISESDMRSPVVSQVTEKDDQALSEQANAVTEVTESSNVQSDEEAEAETPNTEKESQAPPEEEGSQVIVVPSLDTTLSTTLDEIDAEQKEVTPETTVPEEVEPLEAFDPLQSLKESRSTSEQEKLKEFFLGGNYTGTEKELRAFAKANKLTLKATRMNYTIVRKLPKVPSGQYPEGTNFTHDFMLAFELEGNVVFCVQEASPTWNGASYNGAQPITSFLTNTALVKRMNLIAYFGFYANTDKSNAQRAAVQLMLWEEFGGSTLSTTIPNYASRKATINKQIESYKKSTSLKGKTVTVKSGETVSLTDNNSVLSEYEVITNTANVGIKINGNKLEITGKSDSKESGAILLQKKMAISPKDSLVYRNGILQALGYLNDPDLVKDSLSVKVELNGSVKIKKVDENGKALANATFKYTYGSKNGEVTSNSSGEATLNDIPSGSKVTVTEIKAPTGFVLDSTPQTVTVEASKTATLTFKNTPIKGGIKLIKTVDEEWETDATNTFLKDAEFTLYQKDGKTEVSKGSTNEKGEISFSDILYGDYILRETNVPEGYLPVADMPVSIKENNQIIELTAVDNVIRENLKLTKVDIESGQPILSKDAQFEIKNLQTGQLVTHTTELGKESSVFVTNEEGVIFVPQLKYGWYEVKEIYAPNGYIQLKEPVKFKVDGSNNDLIELTITNKPSKGKVIVNKLGQKAVSVEKQDTEFGDLYQFTYDYLDLEGVTYELYAAEDIRTGDGVVHYQKDQIIDEVTTDETGRFEVTGLYPGQYYLIEKEAPNGYIKDKEKVPFEIRYEGQEVELTETDVEHKNDWNEFHVMINKEEEIISGWEDNQATIETIPSQSKVFGLFKRNGFELNGEHVVPENSLVAIVKTIHGVATFQGKLPEGDDYYVKELDAGNHHVLPETEYPVDLTPQDNRDVVQVNVYENKTFVGNDNLNKMVRQPILNKLARQNVKLIKVDNTSYVNEHVLAGVAFDLLKIDGEEEEKVGEFLTDKNGEINIENLPTGQYKFVETQPLENYLPNSEDLTFEVRPSTDGEVIVIKAHNERVAPTLGTMLTDLDGQKLIDSLKDNTLIDTLYYTGMLLGEDEKYEIHFELWERSALGASQDKLVAKSIAEDVVFATEDGEYDMRLEIPANTLKGSSTYYAKEFVYRKTKENPTPEEPFTEHDDRDCEDQTVRTKELPVKYLPQTGEQATVWVSIVGLGLLVLGMVGYKMSRRKES